jgi:hypothetical protein
VEWGGFLQSIAGCQIFRRTRPYSSWNYHTIINQQVRIQPKSGKFMNEVDILSQIYNAITTAPTILTPAFIEQLLTQILPLAESDADNDTVEEAINALYKQFREMRDKIKSLKRKNLDDAEAEVTPGYETLSYPDSTKLEKLKASLKKRIDKANAKN